MTITINGSGTITGATTLATAVASPTFTTPNIDSAQFATVSGTAPLYGCRAWVNFNGTGTVAIRASGNVSSITDGGTGVYTVNFTTAMPDENYVATATSTNRGGGSAGSVNYAVGYGNASSVATNGTYSTSALQVFVQGSGGTAVDVPTISVAIFR